MPKEKITFEQFFDAVEADNKPFVHELHNIMLDNGCKVAFDEAKNGFVASYKYGKPPRAFANFIFRNQGMKTRIYGERAAGYPGFLDTLPATMVEAIDSAGECRRLVSNTCSPNCVGYDFTISGKHYQMCKYNCFEFFITEESMPYIKSFIEHELAERQANK